MRGEVRQWQADLIEWRCALPLSEVRRLRGSTAGWDCADVKLFVGQANFEGVEPAMRDRLNKIPTRLRLQTEELDLAIEAGRLAPAGRADDLRCPLPPEAQFCGGSCIHPGPRRHQ